MPKRTRLLLEGPKSAVLREEALPEPAAHEVRLRSQLSAFKHGTEMEAYWGSSPFRGKTMDAKWRLFRPNPDSGSILYPGTLGNMTVGTVEAVGAEVDALSVGDRVYGWLPIADYHNAAADALFPLDGLTPEQALCIDPANFAIGGLLDGKIAYPDTVLVTGLGAIGLLAVQYCKLSGAKVYASSSFPMRRELARQYGADEVLDRRAMRDMALEVKQMTDGGVDAVLECSGNYAQLQLSMQVARQCGRVVCVGFYSGDASVLNLGEEFFHNRLTLLASLPDAYWNNPVRTEPPRYADTLKAMIVEDFKAGRITAEALLTPEYPLDRAVDAVDAIANSPQDVVKVAIRY
jgi:threonine dehydrogenase-like Zn-dependent dehydrogenase